MFMKASKNAVYLKGSPHFIYIVSHILKFWFILA